MVQSFGGKKFLFFPQKKTPEAEFLGFSDDPGIGACDTRIVVCQQRHIRCFVYGIQGAHKIRTLK